MSHEKPLRYLGPGFSGAPDLCKSLGFIKNVMHLKVIVMFLEGPCSVHVRKHVQFLHRKLIVAEFDVGCQWKVKVQDLAITVMLVARGSPEYPMEASRSL